MNIEKQQTEQQKPTGLHERIIRDGRSQKQMAVAAAELRSDGKTEDMNGASRSLFGLTCCQMSLVLQHLLMASSPLKTIEWLMPQISSTDAYVPPRF